MSERQRIEAAPSPRVDGISSPPMYEEVNDVSTSPMQNGATDALDYFLGEVHSQRQLISRYELHMKKSV